MNNAVLKLSTETPEYYLAIDTHNGTKFVIKNPAKTTSFTIYSDYTLREIVY